MKRYDMRIGFNIPECEDVIKPFESEHGKWVPAEVAQALYYALKEARAQVIEVCQFKDVPLPEASIARYDSALSLADGETE